MSILLYLRVYIFITFFFIFLGNSYCFGSDNNILLYLPFDGDCKASIGNDNGSIQGVPKFEAGKVGTALLIGGDEKPLVKFPGENHIDPKQGTIAFWVKPTDWDSSKEPDFQVFHFFDMYNAYLYRVWKDRISFYCNFPDANIYHLYTADLPLRKGQWTHVALSWLDDVLKIYANGAPVGQFILREPMQSKWHGKRISIGLPASKKHALIDEFYIFDYPLTGSAIKQIYTTSAGGNPPTLPDFKPCRVYATPYPAANKVYVCVDTKHASVDSSPAQAKLFLINSHGQSIPLGEIDKFEAAPHTAAKLFDLPTNLAADYYYISARILDAKERELADVKSETFEKRVYPWEHVNTGLSDEVIPPFTPLKMNNNVISCWGRAYWFKGDGFPEKIMTRKTQILSDAITMEAIINGSNIKLSNNINVITQYPGLVVFNSEAHNNGAHFIITCRVEYDGMMLYNIKIIPEKEISVDRLILNIPIKNNNAKLYHVVRDAIRGNSESDYLPKGYDKIWGSSAKKSKNVLGTFVPYFWIGDYDRGFCWMADSDKNWSVPDNEDCVEFFRDDHALTAKVNFIKNKKEISKPWEVTFALMAGPPRPEPEGWRLGPLSKKWSSWFCGHTETLQGFGKPPKLNDYIKDVKYYKKSWGYWGVNISPNDFWGVTEENKYFQLEWNGGWVSSYPLIHRNNFVMYTLDQFMGKGYIDGLYSDDSYPVTSEKLIAGAAYIRDDGKLQPGYGMFNLRDFFKRSAYLFRKHHCSRSMMVHMTDAMVMPCYSFWDIKNDNEWGRNDHGKTDHTDHIDAWSLGEICARCMSRQYGMAAAWHSQGGADLDCLLLLHDILGRSAKLEERTSPGKSIFGIGEGDVEFLGYWVLQPDKDPEKKGVKMSAWVRKNQGTALVVVANLSQQDWQGRIVLPLKVMGLKPDAVAIDADGKPGPAINFDKGELTLSVSRHNYRFLLIGPKGRFPISLLPEGAKLEKSKINVETAPEKPKMKAEVGPEKPKMREGVGLEKPKINLKPR